LVQNEEEVIAVLRNALRRRMGDRLFDADLEEGREQNVSKNRLDLSLRPCRVIPEASLNGEGPGLRKVASAD
jgi:hypothetical protein